MPDTNTVMRHMGYPDFEKGHYVTLLRESVARQIANGMIARSAGTWSPEADTMSYEDRAKAQLAMDWAIDHGYSHRVENIDGKIIDKRYNVATGKTTKTINWKYILPTIQDKARRVKFKVTKPFLAKNPYL